MNNRPNWQDVSRRSLQPVPANLRAELLNRGSLTARVRELFGSVSVELLRHQNATPELEERHATGISDGRLGLIRDIYLQAGGERRIFAHTVIPLSTLRGEGRQFGRLGRKPLGAALFANPNMHRGPLQVTQLSARHALYHQALQSVDARPDCIFGRRSQFFLPNGRSLLVAEFFLPAFS